MPGNASVCQKLGFVDGIGVGQWGCSRQCRMTVFVIYTLCFSKRKEETFNYDWTLKYMLFLAVYFHVFFTGVPKMHC